MRTPGEVAATLEVRMPSPALPDAAEFQDEGDARSRLRIVMQQLAGATQVVAELLETLEGGSTAKEESIASPVRRYPAECVWAGADVLPRKVGNSGVLNLLDPGCATAEWSQGVLWARR